MRALLPALALATLATVAAACAGAPPATGPGATPPPDLARPGERHLARVRQLTSGGENAEAYFSFDGRWLTFQSTRDGDACDQQYVMRADGSGVRRVSRGVGRTTCGFFLPGDERLVFAATAGPGCPPAPDMSRGYVWPLHEYDLVVAKVDGSDPAPLAPAPGYDAEATVSRDGWIVFTSTRGGDLDLWKMRVDGSQLTQLTHALGYDGGAFFSADGSRIVWRASRPRTAEEVADYRALLAERLVRPTLPLELWVMDADGSNATQLTHLGVASFAPFFFPDGRRIVFASNLGDPRSRNFDLYAIGVDGGGLERITYEETFDSFPMFSPDGRRLVFASNRNAARPGETNIFIAEWVE